MPASSQTNAAPKSPRLVRLAEFVRFQSADLWIKFLLALLGLALAFAAALFSTVSRESGNIWATLVLASAALVLRDFGWAYHSSTSRSSRRNNSSARRRRLRSYARWDRLCDCHTADRHRRPEHRQQSALHRCRCDARGHDRVGVVSALVLRDLELDIRLPEHVFAGKPVLGRILLHNPRRWLPSFSIQVVPSKKKKAAKKWLWEPATFGFPPKRPPEQQWVRLPDRRVRRIVNDGSRPGIFEGFAYFPYLAPRVELSADLELRFQRADAMQKTASDWQPAFPSPSSRRRDGSH